MLSNIQKDCSYQSVSIGDGVKGLLVHFTRDKCLVKNKESVLLKDGDRSRKYCYLLNVKGTCFRYQIGEANLWHEKIGHISFQNVQRLMKTEAIDEESVDATIHVPASVPDSSEHSVPTEVRSEKLDVYNPSKGVQKNHSTSDIIGDMSEGVRTRGVRKNYHELIANNIESMDALITSAVGDESASIEEFAASLDALKFVQEPSALAAILVFNDTPIVTVQVPLGEVSPVAADETLDQGQGEEDVDISFLDEDSPVLEADSVPPQPSRKAISSKTHGTKRKLELRDVPVTPPVSDDEDDTPIVFFKSKKVTAKKGSSLKAPKSVKSSSKSASTKKSVVVPTHRVTWSLSEQRMGLMSGCRRSLMKQTRAPSPSDDEAEVVTKSVSDRSDSESIAYDSSNFYSIFHQCQYKLVVGHSLVSECKLIKADVEGTGVIEFLHDLRLEKSAYTAPHFVAAVVHEFYANLSKSIRDASSEHAFVVFLRGHWIPFSPSVINAYLGREHVVTPATMFELDEVAAELTGGNHCAWLSGHSLIVSDLSVKYSILHKIAVRNWFPSTHNSTIRKPLGLLLFKVGTRVEFNLGQLIFEHVVAHAESSRSQQPISFPGMIFSLTMDVHNVVYKVSGADVEEVHQDFQDSRTGIRVYPG
ncbi:hypothetical protein C2S51_028927 [Perilla frutescens var. frutescens]|nr:hypothetical protein C2S51_028927 [Perilla frutescens var. frutescens]